MKADPTLNLERAYHLLSACTKAIIRAETSQTLLTEICRVLVDIGGYRLAWAGMAVKDAAQTVKPIAQAGYQAGYLETLHISWGDNERGQGPTGVAIRHCRPAVVTNILEDPNYSLWRAEALQRGYQSSLAVPLLHQNQALGALNIYAPIANAFDETETELLAQLAIDVAYGLVNLQAAHRRKEDAQTLQQWARIFEHAGWGTMISHADEGRIDIMNHAFAALYGYKPGQLQGQALHVLFPPQAHAQLNDIIINANEQGYKQFESLGQRQDGTIFAMQGSVTAIAGDQTYPPILVFNIQDITSQKEAEAALKQSREQFRHLVTAISDLIYVSDVGPDKLVINRYVSPNVVRFSGYSMQRFIKNWDNWISDIIHPDDQPTAREHWQHLLNGAAHETEYRLQHRNGSIRWVRDNARPEVHRDGGHTIYGVISDITTRKEHELTLRNMNQALEHRVAGRTRELSTLYEISAISNAAHNLRHSLNLVLNHILPAMRCRSGAIHLLTDDNLHMVCARNLPAPLAEALVNFSLTDPFVARILNMEDPLVIPSIRIDHRLPAEFRLDELESYAAAAIKAHGKVLGILTVATENGHFLAVEDVALLNSIADQLGVTIENARLRHRSERSAVIQERERLARELHDSVTQQLYSLTLFAEAGKALAQNQTQANTLTHHFNRIGETGQQALKEMRMLVHQLRPLDISQVGLINAIRHRLNAVEGRVNIKTRFVADETLALRVDVEEALYRITQEALNNILKHADATQITLSLTSYQDQVNLTIIDNGKGFHVSAAEEDGGMGLSNIVERAEKLNGTVAIDTKPGRGAQINVSLNLQNLPEPELL